MKRVTTSLTSHFVCARSRKVVDGVVEPTEELCDEVQTVGGFCHLGDRLNAKGGCETAVTTGVRLGCGDVKFRECGELLHGKRFSLKMKGRVYRTCVRSAMLYGSETWCLRETEVATLRRTERAMVRAMCGVKLMEKKNTKELMDMLGLSETMEKLAKANGVRWYGHVLRRDEDDLLRKALRLSVDGEDDQERHGGGK